MAALNLSNFTTVINDDFTKDKSLDTSIWTDHWGNPNQYWFTGTNAGMLISGSQAANWNPVGIEQAPTGKNAGEGYGLFSFTGYAGQAGQGVGICFVLWPSDNVWLPSNKPGQASEIDILESWDGTKNGYSTIHFYDSTASGDNGQSIHQIRIDPTVSHTYAMDWERGSLTYYVDGQEIYQDTTHVPLDAADGGVNETLGAEVVNEASYHTTPTVQLYIQDISYSTRNAGGATPPPPAPVPTLALAGLGSVQEASPGAGVTVTETVTATGLTKLYVEVLTASGAVESGWQTITLDGSGKASFSEHLANSGDTIKAVDNTSSPTVTAGSAPITITDPASPPGIPLPSITLAALGSVQEATAGAGVTVTETVSASNLATIHAEVLTKAGVVESGWQTITLDASGKASFAVHLAQTGDVVLAVDTIAASTVTSRSGSVTITDPAVVIPPVISAGVLGRSASGPISFSVLAATSGGKPVLELDIDKAAGASNTLREYVDNKYVGTLRDHLADGSYAIDIPALANGKHTIELTLDGSSATATASFTVPSAQPAPVPPSTPGIPVAAPPAPAGSLLGQSPGGPLKFTAVAVAGGIDLDVTKTIGKAATLREFIDNRYVGTLRDRLADGSYTIATPSLGAGMHTIKLTLDGSAATATATFRIASTVVQSAQVADFAASARLLPALSAPVASSGPVLPDLAGLSGTLLLASLANATHAASPALLQSDP